MAAPTITKALSTLGAVTPETRRKAEAIWLACHLALGRAPGVLWGIGVSSEHATGRALDLMTTQHGRGSDVAMGDWIAQHVIDNAAAYGLGHIIWRQRIWSTTPGGYGPAGRWNPMEDRGSTTENHMDHPHIYFTRDNYLPNALTPSAIPTNPEDDMPKLTDKVTLANGETTYAESLRLNDANQQRLIADVVAIKKTVDDLLAREAQWAPVNFTAILRRLDEIDAKIDGGAK